MKLTQHGLVIYAVFLFGGGGALWAVIIPTIAILYLIGVIG